MKNQLTNHIILTKYALAQINSWMKSWISQIFNHGIQM